MKVTVSVELDDETTVSRTVEVNSGGNPIYWAQGFRTGVSCAQDEVEAMLHAVYGVGTQGEGIHVVKRHWRSSADRAGDHL